MPQFVKRITLFKIPKEEDIDGLLAQYDVLRRTAQKDGKPYIISNEASRVTNTDEERAQGYTVAVQTTFACKADVEYYDQECEAHKTLKTYVASRRTGYATLLFNSDMAP